MKILKEKIKRELEILEKREDMSEGQLSPNTVERVYKLSKALVYLHKACDIVDGKYEHKPML